MLLALQQSLDQFQLQLMTIYYQLIIRYVITLGRLISVITDEFRVILRVNILAIDSGLQSQNAKISIHHRNVKMFRTILFLEELFPST